MRVDILKIVLKLGPVEHIRTRLQVQSSGPSTASSNGVKYNGPVDCVKKIYRQHGLAGIYKGQVPTVWREFGGFGMYFLTYEALVQRAMNTTHRAREDLEAWRLCLYGALAGYSLWLSIFPLVCSFYP